jgi:hypothetical protein
VRARTAIALAAVGSGAPSTIITLGRRGDLLASTRAAGTLVLSDSAPPALRLVAGTCAHGAISTFWGALLWRLLPARHTVLLGGLAGLAVAIFDLGVIGRRYPAIRRLPRGPQLADHVAFGVIIGACRTIVHGGADPAGTLAAL